MSTQPIWTSDTRLLSRYSHVAILLHWAIALLIVFNLLTGFFTPMFPKGIMAFHISSGITILALSIFRIVWRLTHKPPPFFRDMAGWEKGLAHIVHFALYAAMLLLPISGWAMISANPPPGSPGAAVVAAERAAKGQPPRSARPTMIWGVLPLPKIKALQEIGRTPEGLAEQSEKHEQIETFHGLGGYAIVLLLILHIAGALKHQFIDRHREFARMGIGEPERVG